MTHDTIIDFPETPVVYAAGDRERRIQEQASIAFRTLEASLPTLRRRRFFAALVGPEYRACVASEDGNTDPTLSRWVIPGGRYARRKIRDYHVQIPAIGIMFAEMRCRQTSIRRVHASKSIARNTTCMSWCLCFKFTLFRK